MKNYLNKKEFEQIIYKKKKHNHEQVHEQEHESNEY